MTCILSALLFGVFTFLVGLYQGAKTVHEGIIKDVETYGRFRIDKVGYRCEVMK